MDIFGKYFGLKEVQDHLNTFRKECILKADFKENEKLAKEHFFIKYIINI